MNTTVIFLLIGILAVSVPAQTDPVLVRGRWGGQLMQEGVKDFKDQFFFYTVSMHLTQLLEDEQAGTWFWAEVNCRADLMFLYAADGVFRFVTKPTKNSPKNCVPTVVTMKPKTRDKMDIAVYYRTVQKPIATGVLTRLESVESKGAVQQ